MFGILIKATVICVIYPVALTFAISVGICAVADAIVNGSSYNIL